MNKMVKCGYNRLVLIITEMVKCVYVNYYLVYLIMEDFAVCYYNLI